MIFIFGRFATSFARRLPKFRIQCYEYAVDMKYIIEVGECANEVEWYAATVEESDADYLRRVGNATSGL